MNIISGAYLVSLEARFVIDRHLKLLGRVSNSKFGEATQIAIRIIAVTKCQRINHMMAFVVDASVIEESAYATTLKSHQNQPLLTESSDDLGDAQRAYPTTICIYDERKPIKLPNGVYTRRGVLVLGIPNLQISTTSFRARSTKLELGGPFRGF